MFFSPSVIIAFLIPCLVVGFADDFEIEQLQIVPAEYVDFENDGVITQLEEIKAGSLESMYPL